MKTALTILTLAVAMLTAHAGSRAYELSARGYVGFGDNVLIGGIIVGDPPTDRPCEDGGPLGLGPVLFAVRALSTSLHDHGLPVTLYDPVIDFYDETGQLLFSQASYLNNTPATIAILSAYGLIPMFESEAATVIELLPGHYTAVVRSELSTSYGNALLEIYKLSR